MENRTHMGSEETEFGGLLGMEWDGILEVKKKVMKET